MNSCQSSVASCQSSVASHQSSVVSGCRTVIVLTLLFSAIGLVLLLPGAMHAHMFSLLFGAINAACIIYLAMPPIKRAFHAEGNPIRMAA